MAALDHVIRAAQAEQYRRIESARSLAATVEGVADSSSASARGFATRSFVAELATARVVHEATASRLVAEAGRLTGEFSRRSMRSRVGNVSLPLLRVVHG